MHHKLFSVLLIFLLVEHTRLQLYNHVPLVESTTESPTASSTLENIEQLIKEYKNRIEILEFQNDKVQKTLEEKIQENGNIAHLLEAQNGIIADILNRVSKTEGKAEEIREFLKQQQDELKREQITTEENLNVQKKAILEIREFVKEQQDDSKKLKEMIEEIRTDSKQQQDQPETETRMVEEIRKILKEQHDQNKQQETMIIEIRDASKQQQIELMAEKRTVEEIQEFLKEQRAESHKEKEMIAEIRDFLKEHDKGSKILIENTEQKLNRTLHKSNEWFLASLNLPRDCKELQERGNSKTGIYSIRPHGSPETFSVLCDMDTKGGGWTYILKRFDGSQDFYLNWTEYKNGFGKLSGEFWIGLERLYQLTDANPSELYYDINYDVNMNYLRNFSIGSEAQNYRVNILYPYKKNDHFSHSFLASFQTPDHQNEPYGHCVKDHHSSWWFGHKNCRLKRFFSVHRSQEGAATWGKEVDYADVMVRRWK